MRTRKQHTDPEIRLPSIPFTLFSFPLHYFSFLIDYLYCRIQFGDIYVTVYRVILLTHNTNYFGKY